MSTQHDTFYQEGFTSLRNLKVLTAADGSTIGRAKELMKEHYPDNTLIPELVNQSVCWASSDGVEKNDII